jgi:class 3 adenylate cyclase
MPLYMDIHELHGAVDVSALAEAHAADVALQAKYGVEYVKYWFNKERGKVFCLCHAPSAEAANRVHEEAHGLVAERIIEVSPEIAEAFLGGGEIGAMGDVRLATEGKQDTAVRTVLFTDIVDSTTLTQQVGDAAGVEMIAFHDTVVRGALALTQGREVKHTGDGIMASFIAADGAVQCAARIQSALATESYERDGMRLRVRIGAAAGEPVERHHDLFGSTVQLAARLCSAAQPEEILVSESVVDLCANRGVFQDRGLLTLKGFAHAQRAAAVDWRLAVRNAG